MPAFDRYCSVCDRKIRQGKPFQFFARLGPDRSYVCGPCIRKTLTIVKMYEEEYILRYSDGIDALKARLEEQCP